MRIRASIVVVAVAAGCGVSESQTAPPKPAKAKIVLVDEQGCRVKNSKKMVVKVDADGGENAIEWTVTNKCKGKHQVMVGNFAAVDEDTGLKAPVDLAKCGAPVLVASGGEATITCTLLCGEDDFSFDVCIDGFTILDPEIRVKGKVRPPCQKGPADAAAQCRRASER